MQVVTRELNCAHLLAAADASMLMSPARVRITGSRIHSVSSGSSGDGKQLLAMPALVNAHDHARAVRASSFGAAGKPLESWLHYLALLPPVDAYLAAAVSFARSVLGGVGTAMVHYTRVQGVTDYLTEVKDVARAARDVGLRVGFAVALRDQNPLVYGPSEPILAALPDAVREDVSRRFLREPMPVEDQLALVDAVAAAVDGPDFNVQYGPAGVQWCSDALLRGIADASADTGRRVHMHLLETRYQREWADRTYPGGIVRYLKNIGLLTPRLTLAHCTWARPDELDLIAERGATIAVNTSSNLGIRSGVAPVADMIRRGCKVALGLDGLALDEDDDALREMRLVHLLHGGWGYRVDVSRADMLAAAFCNGHRAVMNTDGSGRLAAGEAADILLLNWDKVDSDRLRPDLDPRDLLFARVHAGHIDEVIVGGRSVVREGQVTGIDFPAMRDELLARLRAGINQNAAFAAALPQLDRAICGHFDANAPCC
jgi:cytosine/adenosine deaminase-related metal-dependent hydrolase